MAYLTKQLQRLIVRERRHQDRKHGTSTLTVQEYLRIARDEIDEALQALEVGATRHALNESLQAATVLALLFEKYGFCSRKLEKPRKIKSWKDSTVGKRRTSPVTSEPSTAR